MIMIISAPKFICCHRNDNIVVIYLGQLRSELNVKISRYFPHPSINSRLEKGLLVLFLHFVPIERFEKSMVSESSSTQSSIRVGRYFVELVKAVYEEQKWMFISPLCWISLQQSSHKDVRIHIQRHSQIHIEHRP